MKVSFNTFKPYSQAYGVQNNNHKNNNINFKSGYGAEEFTPIDNPNMATDSESERWKNIFDGIKLMLGKQYEGPKKEKPLFTVEEQNAFKKNFYKKPEHRVENPQKIDEDDESFYNYEED